MPVKIKIIKNGMVEKVFEGKTPLNAEFRDKDPGKGIKAYYRFDIEGEYPHRIFTNPVFVTAE